MKAHIGRWSDDCPEHQGVVVLKMDDTPLVSYCTGSMIINYAALISASGVRRHSEVDS